MSFETKTKKLTSIKGVPTLFLQGGLFYTFCGQPKKSLAVLKQSWGPTTDFYVPLGSLDFYRGRFLTSKGVLRFTPVNPLKKVFTPGGT